MTRREFRDLADPETARDAIAGLDVGGRTAAVPLGAAHGRVLAERVDAPVDVPGFDRAAMDGYAVRAGDTVGAGEADPVRLRVVGTLHAGQDPAAELPADVGEDGLDEGEAVQTATGAVLPPGADAVVPVERTVEGDEAVEVTTAVTPGDSVTSRGADVASGDRALGPGTRLGPRHVGLLAALGQDTVPVTARPRVAVVSTGEELVQPGDALDATAGQVYDVNSHSIAAGVESAGGEAVVHDAASDDPDELATTLATAAEACDLLLTSGSTSAGTVDVLHDLLAERGEVRLHGVALKPGRPLLVGRLFDAAFVGLPGYPVSALTVFRTFVAPRIRDAVGLPEPPDATVTATLARRIRYDGGRLRLVPVGLVDDGSGSLLAYPLGRGSGATTGLVETDGVVRMEPTTSLLSPGDGVTVERFDADDPLPSLLGVGEPDPVVAVLLDGLDAPRYLSLAEADVARWQRDGIPDVTVVDPDVADADPGAAPVAPDDTQPLAAIEREWGLVVPPDNPDDVTGVDDLLAGSPRFGNLDSDLALRGAFDAWLDEHGGGDRVEDVDGYERERPGLESAARGVARGRLDVGLGLRATAEALDLGFVPVGTQRLIVRASSNRREKAGVRAFEEAIDGRLTDLLADTPGYHLVEGWRRR